MLSEGQKVSMDVYPDAVITEDFYLDANEVVHVVIGQEEEEKYVDPIISSKSMTPSDHISICPVNGTPRRTSGDR